MIPDEQAIKRAIQARQLNWLLINASLPIHQRIDMKSNTTDLYKELYGSPPKRKRKPRYSFKDIALMILASAAILVVVFTVGTGIIYLTIDTGRAIVHP